MMRKTATAMDTPTLGERVDGLAETVRREPGAFRDREALAASAGLGVVELDTLFHERYHTAAEAFLGRARLAAACEALAGADSVSEVAAATGYGSVATFEAEFVAAMGLTPEAYRRLGESDAFTVTLPEGYLAWVTPKLLGRDPESVIERVSGDHAVKALATDTGAALLRMEWQGQAVRCRVEASGPLGAVAMRAIHATVIRMLGFWTDPTGFERLSLEDAAIGRLIEGRRGLRVPLSADLFEGVAWSIIGQQVNLPFAYRLRREVARLCGRPVGGDFIAHPTAEAVARLDYADLTARQFSRRKAEYLIDTARLLAEGAVADDPLQAAGRLEKQLLAIRGLGPWSVNYIMMRGLGYADCTPLGDTGLSTALQRYYQMEHRPSQEETATLMQPFAPYRSLATYHLWMSLGKNPA